MRWTRRAAPWRRCAKALEKLAEAMRGQGEGEVRARRARTKRVKVGQGQFGAAEDTDPLGRPAGSERAFNPKRAFRSDGRARRRAREAGA